MVRHVGLGGSGEGGVRRTLVRGEYIGGVLVGLLCRGGVALIGVVGVGWLGGVAPSPTPSTSATSSDRTVKYSPPSFERVSMAGVLVSGRRLHRRRGLN